MPMILAVVLVFQLNFSLCWCLNSEGMRVIQFCLMFFDFF